MISPDLPITKSEDDKLNRYSFAKSLAKTLLQSSFSSSFTVGLYGEWGSGKTSLLNMVFEIVESTDSSIVVLKFNPWLCSEPKQLITQFFKQMATAIKMKKPAMDHVWELVDQYADVFDAASVIPIAGTVFSAAGGILNKKAKKHVAQRASDLQGMKDQIMQKLAEENLKIIISIDDIDRLSEEEIISVFQLVKALADFPNTIYLLAFDYEVVIHALSKVQYGDGKEYLEKVIQVPFEIPAPSMTSIHDSLFLGLNTILGDIPEDRWDKETWAELFQFGLKKYIRSIRDVIRYTNVFSLKYELLRYETNPVDLFGLTCLQVFEPVIYSRLSGYKEVLCGTSESYSYEWQKNEEEKAKKAMDALIPDPQILANVEAAKTVLGILFPRVQAIIGSSYHTGRYYTHKSFLINGNIAVSTCFDRYFSLTLEEDAIPKVIVEYLVYQANETKFGEEIRRVYQDGKIIRLLEEIQAYADKESAVLVSTGRASLIIKCLARQWSFFKVDDSGFFSVPFTWRFLFCVEPLLEAMELADRYDCICEVFEDCDVRSSTLALLLGDFERQQGRFTEKGLDEKRQLLSLDQVLELEELFRVRAVEELDSGKAMEQPNGLRFLWLLEQVDAETAANKKKSIITDDRSLIKVISYCTSHGEVAGRTVTKIWKVDQKAITEFIDINDAYRRVCAFVTSNQFLLLSKDEQMDAVAFLIDMENNAKQGTTENEIIEKVIQKKLIDLTNCSKPLPI